jgi:hypothetical protein
LTIGGSSRPQLAAAAGISLAFLGLLFSETVMAEECPPSAPLVLKDTQSGFAGETGNVWTIALPAPFIITKAELLFEFLIIALDRPPQLCQIE